jgi:hypothetical protein
MGGSESKHEQHAKDDPEEDGEGMADEKEGTAMAVQEVRRGAEKDMEWLGVPGMREGVCKMMDLISRQALKEALEDEIRLRIAIQPNRSHNDQIMADIRWIIKIVDEMPSVYKVPLELTEEEKAKCRP